MKWIANGQDIWFELTYKIDLDKYKNTFGFYGEYCNETWRSSALKCKPDIYDENDYYLSHNLLNPATKRQVIHEDEFQILWRKWNVEWWGPKLVRFLWKTSLDHRKSRKQLLWSFVVGISWWGTQILS